MTPAELSAAAAAWQQQGRAAVVVWIREHRGSVPRETGTRMVVAAEQFLGTIGGGHLELRAIEQARGMLKTAAGIESGADREPAANTEPVRQRIALGPSLGQCCGGDLQLQYTLLQQEDLATWTTPPPRFMLQLYGAGHVGRAIVHLLRGLHCEVQWIDERESEFPTEALPSHIQRVCVEPVEAEVALAPPGAFYLVLTHSHALDLALTQAILSRGDFGYFGLIGSASKRARFERRLRDGGHSPELLSRMVCPIGIAGINGKEPEVLAVAVVAQLLQQKPAAA